MKATSSKILTVLSIGFACLTASSHAAVILGTDFSGTTTSGTNMSGVSWTQNGLAAAPASTVGASANLFTSSSGNTTGHLAGNVNLNTTPAGWFFTVAFTTGNLGITLSDIDIEGTNFNSAPAWQPNNRSLAYTVDILNASNTVIGTLPGNTPAFHSGNSTGNSNGGRSYLANYEFSSPIDLAANTDYTFRMIIQQGPTSPGGSFGGINSFSLNGTADPIPEPTTALLGGIGMLLLLRRRR